MSCGHIVAALRPNSRKAATTWIDATIRTRMSKELDTAHGSDTRAIASRVMGRIAKVIRAAAMPDPTNTAPRTGCPPPDKPYGAACTKQQQRIKRDTNRCCKSKADRAECGCQGDFEWNIDRARDDQQPQGCPGIAAPLEPGDEGSQRQCRHKTQRIDRTYLR